MPASELFSDFQALCRAVTGEYYQSEWGLEYDRKALIGVPAAIEHRQKAMRASEATLQITGGLVRFSNPVKLPEVCVRDREKAFAELRTAKSDFERSSAALRAEIEKFDQAWERRFHLNTAEALLRAHITIDAKAFGVSRSNAEVVDEAIRSVDRQISSFEQVVERARAMVERRLASARDVALLEDASTTDEWNRLTIALNALAGAAPPLLGLQLDAAGMSVILQNSTGREQDENLIMPLNNIGASAQGKLNRALSMLGSIPYPFERLGERKTLAAYLTEGTGQAVLEIGITASNRAVELYFKLLDRLAAFAVQAETSLRRNGLDTELRSAESAGISNSSAGLSKSTGASSTFNLARQ